MPVIADDATYRDMIEGNECSALVPLEWLCRNTSSNVRYEFDEDMIAHVYSVWQNNPERGVKAVARAFRVQKLYLQQHIDLQADSNSIFSDF